MIEFGVEDYKSPKEFGKDLKIPVHARPLVIFNGEGFGFDRNLMKLHNVMTGLNDSLIFRFLQ
jgi:ribosome production factor 2